MKRLQAEHAAHPERASSKSLFHLNGRDDFKFLEQRETIISNFYYSFRGGYTESSHELMLRSIAYQIFGQNHRLFALIRDRFRTLKSDQSDWRYQDLKSTLLSLHETPFQLRVFIAVDGMDQSDKSSRDDVLEFLSKLSASESRCTVKVLIASRPENDIRPWMNCARHVSLEKMNHEDIRIIVRSGVRELQQYRQATLDHETAAPEVAGQEGIFTGAEDYILANSHGVFLWVVLVLRQLENFIRWGGYSLEDVDNCVRSLPMELGGSRGFYAVMVERLARQTSAPPNHEARGRRIFAWITFSTRHLSVSELRDAMAVPPQLTENWDPAAFDLARLRPNDFERGLSSLCGGFTEVRIAFDLKRP